MDTPTKPVPTDITVLVDKLQNKPLEEILTRLINKADEQTQEIRDLKQENLRLNERIDRLNGVVKHPMAGRVGN